MIRLSFYFLVAALLAACATMNRASNPDELARTLDKAIVAIPVSKYLKDIDSESDYAYVSDDYWRVKNKMAKIPAEANIPLVIYMHGCSGISWKDRDHIAFLFENNYAVLAPDSFARKYKPKSCNPDTYTGGLHRGVLRFRLAEASYAHKFAKTLPWVDKQNIFLLGWSTGGIGIKTNYPIFPKERLAVAFDIAETTKMVIAAGEVAWRQSRRDVLKMGEPVVYCRDQVSLA